MRGKVHFTVGKRSEWDESKNSKQSRKRIQSDFINEEQFQCEWEGNNDVAYYYNVETMEIEAFN